jgi:hypothetical protein
VAIIDEASPEVRDQVGPMLSGADRTRTGRHPTSSRTCFQVSRAASCCGGNWNLEESPYSDLDEDEEHDEDAAREANPPRGGRVQRRRTAADARDVDRLSL